MNTCLTFPALRTGYRKVALLGILLLGVSLKSFAQTNPLTQTFGDNAVNDANYPFTSITPAANVGLNGTGAFAPDGSNGTGAYGISLANNGNGNGGSIQLDFVTKTFAAGSGTSASRNKLSFKIASLVAQGAASNNGFDSNVYIDVYLAFYGNALPASPQLHLVGNLRHPCTRLTLLEVQRPRLIRKQLRRRC